MLRYGQVLALFLLFAFNALPAASGDADHHRYSGLADLSAELAASLHLGEQGSVPVFGGKGARQNSQDPSKAVLFNSTTCSSTLSQATLSEIQSYATVVDQIVTAATAGVYQGATYGNLSYFVDTFDDRISGSDGLEASIDFLAAQMRGIGFDNVWTEDVRGMPAWRRGSEVARMVSPKKKDIAIVGLGSTAPTSIFGITSQAIVFQSYDQLVANKAMVSPVAIYLGFQYR